MKTMTVIKSLGIAALVATLAGCWLGPADSFEECPDGQYNNWLGNCVDS
ncbi:MAG: hypothetical protein ACR2PJ_00695 [Pseudomonadales bacterium]